MSKVRMNKTNKLEVEVTPGPSTSRSLNRSEDPREQPEAKPSRAPMKPILPENKSYSSICKQSSKRRYNRNKTFAEGWTVSENSLTLDGSHTKHTKKTETIPLTFEDSSSGDDDSVRKQVRDQSKSFKVHIEIDKGGDVADNNQSNISDDDDSIEFGDHIKENKSSASSKHTKKTETIPLTFDDKSKSFNVTCANKKRDAKASVSYIDINEGGDIVGETEGSNFSVSHNNQLNASDDSIEPDDLIKSSSKSTNKAVANISKEPSAISFTSVLLTSDDDDDIVENASSKTDSKDASTFELTESVNDISVLPRITTDYDTNETLPLGNLIENSVIEISSGTPSKLSRKTSQKRITFKLDAINVSSSSSSYGARRPARVAYAKSPHSKKFKNNRQPKVDQSSYFESSLLDSKIWDQDSGTYEVVDLTTPVKKASNGIMQYQVDNKEESSLRNKRKTYVLPSSSSQVTANQTEPQDERNGNTSIQINVTESEPRDSITNNADLKPPLFSSTPFHPQPTKSSPKKKALLHKPGGGAIKKISPKKKSPLKCVIQKTKMPNFKAIHQKALTKMENIVDLKERKAARARLLLSGGKPASSPSAKNPGGKSRKVLDYCKVNEDVATSVDLKPLSNKKKVMNNNIPRPATPISKPVLRRVEQHQLKVQSKIPQYSKPQKNKIEIKKQIKSVATKSKADHNNGLEQRRNEIGNVRLNRRFELLMKMRMK